MPNRYTMFAGYNAWANARVYDAASALSDADYRADRGAFFRSVHGTLNHILVADRIWMRRFTGTGPSPTRLDDILFEDFSDLRNARRAEDRRIVDYMSGLNDADLAGLFRYRTVTNPANCAYAGDTANTITRQRTSPGMTSRSQYIGSLRSETGRGDLVSGRARTIRPSRIRRQ